MDHVTVVQHSVVLQQLCLINLCSPPPEPSQRLLQPCLRVHVFFLNYPLASRTKLQIMCVLIGRHALRFNFIATINAFVINLNTGRQLSGAICIHSVVAIITQYRHPLKHLNSIRGVRLFTDSQKLVHSTHAIPREWLAACLLALHFI